MKEIFENIEIIRSTHLDENKYIMEDEFICIVQDDISHTQTIHVKNNFTALWSRDREVLVAGISKVFEDQSRNDYFKLYDIQFTQGISSEETFNLAFEYLQKFHDTLILFDIKMLFDIL
jgi:hypothetical protein